MFVEKELYDKIIEKTIPEPNTGCWLWTKSGSKGYGQITYKQHNFICHRSVCAYTNNLSLNDHFIAMHMCNTPACCNPLHIKPGTQKENLQYASQTTHKIKSLTRTHCKKGHELSGENLFYNKSLKSCRACRTKSQLKHYHSLSKEQKERNLKRSNEWKKQFYHKNKDLMKQKHKQRSSWLVEYRKRKREKDKLLICILYSLGILKIKSLH